MAVLMLTGRVGGYALHFDVQIPPEAGFHRLEILHARGTRELLSAKRLLSNARDRVGCQKKHRLDSPHAPWWFYAPAIVGKPTSCRGSLPQRADGEVPAREALSSAVRAFNLLEDLPEADDAHRLIHESGMFVSRHFGCRIELRDGLWRWHCPVVIAHLRVGQSPGFTAVRICSICRENIMLPDRCMHMANETYEVTVSDTLHCPCGSRECRAHRAGEVIQVAPVAITEEVDSLQEISWVARPRDPLARIDEISYTSDQMASFMRTDIPSDMRVIECFHCRQACTGLWDFETLGKVLARDGSAQQSTGQGGLPAQFS
jgi:hypothetical protein